MSIWAKYFFCDTLKTILYLLTAFCTLYVLIDYASHSGTFHHHHIRFSPREFFIYYGAELVQKSEVLLPFAILIATIRVLTKLNLHNELIALLAAGIKVRKLLSPFLAIGLIGVLFLYLSEECFAPWLVATSRSIGEKQAGEQSMKLETPSAHRILLEDGTLLLFQTYSRLDQRFYDVWWVPSVNELWRIKTLDLQPQVTGTEVELFKRDSSQALVSVKQMAVRNFPEIRFNQKRLLESLTRPEDLSLSTLAGKLTADVSSEKEARLETAFWRKIFMPWLALLAVLGPAPLCLVFTRNLNTFFIYAVSMFALIFTYILLNASTTLADRQVFSPLPALLIPFGILSTFLLWRWQRVIKI